MTRPFRTEPEASTELGEAAQWYEQRRSGLGIEFLEAIDTALEFIARFPEAGAPVPGVPELTRTPRTRTTIPLPRCLS